MTDLSRSAPAAGGTSEGGDGDLITVIGLGSALLRQRWVIAGTAFLLAVAALVWSLARASYVASAMFVPAGQSSPLQGVASIAQAIGINFGGSSSTPSLDFYQALLGSRELLTAALETEYRFRRGTGPGDSVSESLLEVYGYSSQDRNRQTMSRAIASLKRDLTVSANAGANTVSLHVRARWPSLAEAVGSRLLALVNEFDVERLQSQASAERRFLERRVDSTRMRLAAAEDSMRTFLERNRSYEDSPRLVFERQRLQRGIDLQQQVLTALDQSYEQARLAEVQNTPVITVVDSAHGSAVRQRHAARNVIVGFLVGMVLGLLIGLGREHLRREREAYPREFEEFVNLRRQMFRMRN